jgi:hypothetical protein
LGKDHSRTVANICDALTRGDRETASQIARDDYPFAPIHATKRRYTELQSARLFVRDGFVDRYSGSHLVFPATLRLLSQLLPEEFPAHPNWKMSESHIAYWELFPTVDHVVPIARGGADTEENWVTTSMLRNSAKSNWTMEELGWQLSPPGDIRQWDGLMSWFFRYVENHPSVLADTYLKRWHRASLSIPLYSA